MQFLNTILASVSLAGVLAAALPQQSGAGSAVFARQQPISPDNTCGLTGAGAGIGYRCPGTGEICCSQHGWCGATEAYCGTGCQPGYGACNGVPPPQTTTTSTRTSTTSTRTSTTTTSTPTPTPTGRARPGSVPYGVQLNQCTTPGVVALTFDDGPYAYTPELLTLLARYDVKATFFVNGQNWGNPITTDPTQQNTLLTAYNAGHHIASHTFSHPDLGTLDAASIRNQMLTLETALKNIIGVYPTYMRPPYFSCGAACLSVMDELSYHVIYANIDPLDWANNTPATVGNSMNAYNNAISSVPANQGRWIVLNHDVHATTVRQLAEYEILRARELGYRLVTIGECFGDPQANWYRV